MHDRGLATWLVSERRAIDVALRHRLGDAAPADDAPESEALRRFRSFAVAALARGQPAEPALEGLRLGGHGAARLLDAWVRAASETAGPAGERVAAALAPLRERFEAALRATAPARRQGGGARPGRRRAVAAAIDRVADAFLAVDADSALIADANPAAAALLATRRDALLGASLLDFVPEPAHALWRTHLDAVLEGGEPLRFRAPLRDVHGLGLAVEVRSTRYATRTRTLALLVARPEPCSATPAARAGTAPGGSTRPAPPPGGTSGGGSRS